MHAVKFFSSRPLCLTMGIVAVPLLVLLFCSASFARTPLERLEVRHLEAVHTQRIEWMKQRFTAAPPLGVYQDFRAVSAGHAESSEQLLRAAKGAEARVVLFPNSAPLTGLHDGVLFLGNDRGLPQFPDQAPAQLPSSTPKERRGLEDKFKQYPDEVFAVTGEAFSEKAFDAAFRNASYHILARELTEADVRASLAAGHLYLAHDWLCDPAGFSLIAESDLGVFDIGDEVPMLNTHIEARVPVAAKLKLFRNGAVVAEANDSKILYTVQEQGDYRLEAWLTVDGEDRLWIYSNPLQLVPAPSLRLPSIQASPNVEVRRDIVYFEGDPANAAKHKLDLYLPKDQHDFPVMVFIHGGSWRSGDRALYGALGYRFAKLGIGVAIPSYRLMPGSPHPAQMEDVAAAFAWVQKNIGQLGGDTKRNYLVGHSAGGHLAALLALDQEYLKKHDIPEGAIRGVVALSGVYNVSRLSYFVSDAGARDASPLAHVRGKAPPFLMTYCQWDYLGLPKQARDFAAALRRDFVGAQLVYIPGKSHISEMVDIWQDDDPSARAILNFVK